MFTVPFFRILCALLTSPLHAVLMVLVTSRMPASCQYFAPDRLGGLNELSRVDRSRRADEAMVADEVSHGDPEGALKSLNAHCGYIFSGMIRV